MNNFLTGLNSSLKMFDPMWICESVSQQIENNRKIWDEWQSYKLCIRS